MRILIVESNAELGRLWQDHIARHGHEVVLAAGEAAAEAALAAGTFRLVVLDLVLAEGSALALAALLSWRSPETRVICVTSAGFFSDGSIFRLISNAAALLPGDSRPEDLAMLVDWHCRREPGEG